MSDLLLTPRQAEVLSLIKEGLGNKSISKKLGISDSATDAHITNVFDKLEVNNRTKAAAMYFKAQLAQASTKIDRLCEMLSIAKCPDCDGSGAIVVDGVGCEAGCCGNPLSTGECCGNAVPVQVQTKELAQCQWCGEKDILVKEIKDNKP